MGANFGIAGMDWHQRVNWSRLREYRIDRARAMMKKHGLGALLGMYDENVRYITGMLTPGRNRLKPGLRYAMLDEHGPKLLQARPLRVEAAPAPDQIWLQHPGLRGHPAGIGWGAGRSVVVRCECELARVGQGDILVTQVAGPALGQVLARVAGVVTELGGSTSHLASLARERGIPMVLGVLGATHKIPDGSQVAIDGVAGIVRWMS